MKLWLYQHRAAVKSVYCFLALTVILILTILEAAGNL